MGQNQTASNNNRGLNDLFRDSEGSTKETTQKEGGESFYPRLPSYSEVPSTHPSYLQYNHTGTEPYIPPWNNGTVTRQDSGGVPHSSRFGLIRGYHQQMYEQNQKSMQCCDCIGLQPSGQRSDDKKCNWAVICGALFIILGVFALIMGFTLPQKTYTDSEMQSLTPQEKKDADNIDAYIELFILAGLSLLSLGGLVISLGILYPVCRRGKNEYEDSVIAKYYDSEIYVKEQDVPSSGKAEDQKTLVNFGFHKNIMPTDVTLRKIQPEREPTEPIEMDSKLFK